MDQDHTISRKRTNRPCALPNESLCQCRHFPCHNDECGSPSPKRKKPQRRLRTPLPHPPPPQEAPLESASGSSHELLTNLFDATTGTNININLFRDFFSLFPPATSPDLQQHLSYENHQFLQRNSEPGNNIVDGSASCTLTNDTFSPREAFWDPNDFTIQSPNFENEFSFDGPGPFDLGLDNNEESWVVPNDGHLTFSHSVEFEAPIVSEPVLGPNSNTYSFSYQFPQGQPGRRESPFKPDTCGEFIGEPNEPPWFPQQAIQNSASNRLENKIPHQAVISTETLQPNFPATSKWKDLQPSKRSSTTSSTLEWSNSTAGAQSVQPLPVGKPLFQLPPKSGFRDGPLSPEDRAHARRMRQQKSCWPCRLVKVKCSFGNPCTRCIKISSSQRRWSFLPTSPYNHILCYRGALADFTDMLFPDHVTSRYSEETINSLIKNNVVFTENKIIVEMLSGLDYPTITLTATVFQCLNPDFLVLDYVIPNKDGSDQCQTFTKSYAPPIGLHEIRPDDLRTVCLKHIESIISQKRDIGEVNHGDISMITLKSFEAVNSYRKTSPEGAHSALLKQAVMLYAMHQFMSRITPLTERSAEKVIQQLQRPQSLPFVEASHNPPIITARLLNVQIKHAMQRILRDMTGEVLKSFETEMVIIPQKPDTWADNFCIVLILCMCIETAQVGSDSRAMTKLRTDRTCTLSRSQLCQHLDHVPFTRLTHLLHTAYKTNRAKANNKGKLGFNPVQFGFPNKAVEGITPQMRTLVSEVKQIMVDHGREMARLVEDPSFDNPKPDLLTHHMAFRRKNSGRLVSKFLLSFVPIEAII